MSTATTVSVAYGDIVESGFGGEDLQEMSVTFSWYNTDHLSQSPWVGIKYGTTSPPATRSPLYIAGSWYGEYKGGIGAENISGTDTETVDGTTSGGYTHGSACNLDTTYYFRAYHDFRQISSPYTVLETAQGTIISKKTYADDPTVGTPTLDNETSTSVRVNGSVTPQTNESTVDVYVQYKKTSDSIWSTFGTLAADGISGTTSQAITATTVTGLDPAQAYDFRLYMDRSNTTNPTTDYYGSSAGTSTLPGTPSLTGVAASSVSHAAATLNVTVDHNGENGTLTFYWDTDDPGTPDAAACAAADGNVAYGGGTITADGTYGQNTGAQLSAATLYYFWSSYVYGGGTVYSNALSFTTGAAPAGSGQDGDDMLKTVQFDGKYGVAKTIYFTLLPLTALSYDTYYTGAVPPQSRVKIVKDGTYDSTSDNAVTQVDSGDCPQLYSLTLSATEMQAEIVDVFILGDGGTLYNFRDAHFQIRTKKELSVIDIDASQMSNTTAVTFTGSGTGDGFSISGGSSGKSVDGLVKDMIVATDTLAAGGTSSVTLGTSASGSNDFYNHSVIVIVSGSGAGQARVISDYVGATKVASLSRDFDTAVSTDQYIIIPGPEMWRIAGAEITSVSNVKSAYALMLQEIFQRYIYKRTQTATQFTLFESNGTTQFAVTEVDDDGKQQLVNKLQNP